MPRLLPFFAFALLGACGFGQEGPVVIDGSSPEAFEQSLRDAKADLGPKDRIKFEAALAEFRAQMFAKAGTREEYQRLVRDGMDGLTAPLIVSKFNSNVDKAGRDVADTIFDVKRAVTGGRREAAGETSAPESQAEEPSSRDRGSEYESRYEEQGR
jgi:hypothetical protein